jgi:hypothetical protein
MFSGELHSILLPLHQPLKSSGKSRAVGHWTLGVLMLASKEIVYMNSLPGCRSGKGLKDFKKVGSLCCHIR